MFVVKCVPKFSRPCFQLHNMILPTPAKCYTIGMYSRCLSEWDHPEEEVEGIFMRSKSFTSIEVPRKMEKKGDKRLFFFYGKVVSLLWDPDQWRWGDGGRFLDYTTKNGREILTSGNQGSTRAADK